MRSAILGYMFDFREKEGEADMSFEGFKQVALNPDMLAELDAFGK